MAPITPFITEEIYQLYFKSLEKYKSLHITNWPEEIKLKEKNTKILDRFIEILEKVRQSKSDAKKSVKAEIILTIPEADIKLLENTSEDLKAVTNSKEIKPGKFKVEFA
jgi:valyl-tRNA synthetase